MANTDEAMNLAGNYIDGMSLLYGERQIHHQFVVLLLVLELFSDQPALGHQPEHAKG